MPAVHVAVPVDPQTKLPATKHDLADGDDDPSVATTLPFKFGSYRGFKAREVADICESELIACIRAAQEARGHDLGRQGPRSRGRRGAAARRSCACQVRSR